MITTEYERWKAVRQRQSSKTRMDGEVMGRRIDKQNNGKYEVWSSIAEGYILKDVTPEEIINFYIEEAKENITESVMRQINQNVWGFEKQHTIG